MPEEAEEDHPHRTTASGRSSNRTTNAAVTVSTTPMIVTSVSGGGQVSARFKQTASPGDRSNPYTSIIRPLVCPAQ
jgi:hypothetical protein